MPHLDRLTSTDAALLHQEGRSSHMHIGGVLVFGGPPPALDDFLAHVRGRLPLVPRYCQKLTRAPLDIGRPLWIDDPDFNLEYHVRQTALPAPGTEEQLKLLAARLASQRLDRAKPLWEMWLVEGLAENRFAIIYKTHHALAGGISGLAPATVIFDLSPEDSTAEEDLAPWRPAPEPSDAELLLAGVRGAVRTATGLTTRALAAAARPESPLAVLRNAAEGLGEVVGAALDPAPETPLDVEIGPYRRYATVRQRLSDYSEIRDALGGTVDDIVLTVVSGALGGWLRARGVRTRGLLMRALVPVSVRGDGGRGALGDQLTLTRGPLPVSIDDPVARLRFIRHEMDGLKESRQAVVTQALAAIGDLAPPVLLARAARLSVSTRLFNLLLTNVPGPQLPLYVLGRPLQDFFPIAFLPERHALSVAVISYEGALDFGLLADYDAMPDLESFAEGLDHALTDLRAAARTPALPAGAPAGLDPPAADGPTTPTESSETGVRTEQTPARSSSPARTKRAVRSPGG